MRASCPKCRWRGRFIEQFAAKCWMIAGKCERCGYTDPVTLDDRVLQGAECPCLVGTSARRCQPCRAAWAGLLAIHRAIEKRRSYAYVSVAIARALSPSLRDLEWFQLPPVEPSAAACERKCADSTPRVYLPLTLIGPDLVSVRLTHHLTPNPHTLK